MKDTGHIPSGALLMIGLPDLSLDDSTRELIDEQRINNFILFARNIESPGQLTKLCRELQQASLRADLPPPLIAIDQEGGTVSRLPSPWTQFPDQRRLAAAEDPEAAVIDYARTCAGELREAGINLNLAPVLDVCPKDEGYFMELRSLGDNPARVGLLGSLIIKNMQAAGVAACAKHFPGLGAARLDPHLSLSEIEQSREELLTRDLPPFQAAIDQEVAAIMTSHTVYSNLAPGEPATLAKPIIGGILRDEMAYQGLVITDDLEMGAIENEKDVAEAAVLAFNAGADLLLICRHHDKIRRTLAALDTARRRSDMDQAEITKSFQRISRVRRTYATDG